MKPDKLRQIFIEFFKKKGHKVVPSVSLVPEEADITESDKTLFISAGMQQFKRFYADPIKAPYKKAVSCQKCVRTSDINEVGDESHLTFFEMLGNFSFNDYFKKEAIEYAWEFLTEILKIDKSRIDATYFKGEKGIPEDKESLEILQSIDGLENIKAQGSSDNFWSLGTEDSPGGPTVEFYVDGIEVWNLVINQYTKKEGKYVKSKYKGIDTGMGLERLSAVINGQKDVFETDLSAPIIIKIDEIAKKKYQNNLKEFRIIADHTKAAVFAINDGILPSNKEAGYVVRRLLRRAITKSQQLGIKKTFLSELAKIIFSIYGKVYEFDRKKIIFELEQEEVKFSRVLEQGLKEFEKHKNKLTGEVAFKMYQTFGFPLELTEELALEQNIQIDKEEFERAFKRHQELSRTASAGMFKGGLADSGETATKYHTATHLLHAALRQVLGEGVQQKGSNITAERMRFDFIHPDKMTPDQIKEVEDLVNGAIEKNLPVTMEEMSPEEAKKSGALGFFEHKYTDKVKVYSVGSFSKEICGGPHSKNTGALGYFKIQKEESSSAGVRRIKAILE